MGRLFCSICNGLLAQSHRKLKGCKVLSLALCLLQIAKIKPLADQHEAAARKLSEELAYMRKRLGEQISERNRLEAQVCLCCFTP